MLCQVECCLNSRPLVPLQSHSDDGIDVLTPGHFLIGRNLQALPEIDLTSKKLPLLRRWSLLQAISQHFWRRWSTEYLQQLQRFNKWRTPTANLQVDDIVLIKEDGLVSNSHWPMGKIVRIYPGKDGHVRVVAIKTKTGTYKRPTAKIVRLIALQPSYRGQSIITSGFTQQLFIERFPEVPPLLQSAKSLLQNGGIQRVGDFNPLAWWSPLLLGVTCTLSSMTNTTMTS